MCVCVCVCARARARVCACVRVCVKERTVKNLSSTRMEKGAEETCPIMMTSIGVGIRAFSSLGTTEWSAKG